MVSSPTLTSNGQVRSGSSPGRLTVPQAEGLRGGPGRTLRDGGPTAEAGVMRRWASRQRSWRYPRRYPLEVPQCVVVPRHGLTIAKGLPSPYGVVPCFCWPSDLGTHPTTATPAPRTPSPPCSLSRTSTPVATPGRPYRLKVSVVDATIDCPGAVGSVDPRLYLSCGGQEHRTSGKCSTNSPVWNESLVFDGPCPLGPGGGGRDFP